MKLPKFTVPDLSVRIAWLKGRKGKARRILLRALGVTTLVAVAVSLAGPLTFDRRTHLMLDTATQELSWLGDQVLGLDVTAPRQNLFSFVRDVSRVIEVADHADVHRSRMLSLMNFASRGRIHTVADVLRWYDIPLTSGQAGAVGLCRPLDALWKGEPIVIQPDPFQHGVASWYGPGFHGRTAASGEIYNMYDRTAAHKTLPLQSMVRVVSQKTGQSTVVRINDRGPYVRGRIIDMSRRAMDLLGAGDLAAVYLERLDPDALDVVCP